jgi:hypothetical protein
MMNNGRKYQTYFRTAQEIEEVNGKTTGRFSMGCSGYSVVEPHGDTYRKDTETGKPFMTGLAGIG